MSMRAAGFAAAGVYENVNPRIVELYERERRVLDVGCGTGALGAALKKLNPSAVIDGIDCSPEAGAAALGRIDGFTCLDLDAGALPPVAEPYDLIVLGDVLEHLKRPDLLLNALKGALAPRGKVIVSVPNVANYSIRLRLLLGRFEYAETGIMDRTHLRFFTCRSARELMESCGYRVTASRCISRFPRVVAEALPGLLAVQIVMKLELK